MGDEKRNRGNYKRLSNSKDVTLGSSQFFLPATGQLDEQNYLALIKEKFSEHPLFKKTDLAPEETYKQLYERLNKLYQEIVKQQGQAFDAKNSQAVKTREKQEIELFAKIVADGFDKFELYFPQLRPKNINIKIEGRIVDRFLLIAAANGQIEFVRKILSDWGGQVDIVGSGYIKGDSRVPGSGRWVAGAGKTALILAARHGHLNCLKMLLRCNARINFAAKDDGTTALHAAAISGQNECVAYLLQQRASTDLENADGAMAYQVANDGNCRNLITAEMRERLEPVEDEPSCCFVM